MAAWRGGQIDRVAPIVDVMDVASLLQKAVENDVLDPTPAPVAAEAAEEAEEGEAAEGAEAPAPEAAGEDEDRPEA